jgi:hypothetical protein
LRLALDELGSTRRIATNQPIIVLLTDGVQYEEPQTAQAVALEVRTAGVSIYAIGLGADVDAAFLHALAGAPSRYYFAPTEGDLEAIYRQIARTIPCPPQRFWRGGRPPQPMTRRIALPPSHRTGAALLALTRLLPVPLPPARSPH